jgi:hypothetical protein
VLLHAIGDGMTLLTWEQDSFAFADSFDEARRVATKACAVGRW